MVKICKQCLFFLKETKGCKQKKQWKKQRGRKKTCFLGVYTLKKGEGKEKT